MSGHPVQPARTEDLTPVRRLGGASRPYAALEREAPARGITRLWATARTPAFLLAHGIAATASGHEHDILIGECPRWEGEKWRDRD